MEVKECPGIQPCLIVGSQSQLRAAVAIVPDAGRAQDGGPAAQGGARRDLREVDCDSDAAGRRAISGRRLDQPCDCTRFAVGARGNSPLEQVEYS